MAGGKRKLTKIKIAKGVSEYKVLDNAITKATNPKQLLPKEKHVQTIFNALSPSTPRVEVVYCLYSISMRLGQTHNWTVALKTLMIIHRAMRELDDTVWEEFINYSRDREHILNLLYFQDSSTQNALDYSAWIRSYAFYLDERLRCFAMLNYDVVMASNSKETRFETMELLEQLPLMQELQSKLLKCKPKGAALQQPLLQYALSTIGGESVRLYAGITLRVVELLDRYFGMNRPDAIKALEIYKRSGNQAETLAVFFETCRGVELGMGHKFINKNIKESSSPSLPTLEEYLKETPRTLTLEHQMQTTVEQGGSSKEDGGASSEAEMVIVANNKEIESGDVTVVTAASSSSASSDRPKENNEDNVLEVAPPPAPPRLISPILTAFLFLETLLIVFIAYQLKDYNLFGSSI